MFGTGKGAFVSTPACATTIFGVRGGGGGPSTISIFQDFHFQRGTKKKKRKGRAKNGRPSVPVIPFHFLIFLARPTDTTDEIRENANFGR